MGAFARTLLGALGLAACTAGPPRIDADRVGVVLIDAQPAFWRMMHGKREPVEERIEQLLLLSAAADRPLVATFEAPTDKNGWLPDRLEEAFPRHGHRLVKHMFDCCREPGVRAVLEGLGVGQVVLAGAETDVCVLQSALGLLEMGFEVFVLEDCLFSNEGNVAPALARMYAAGAVPCTYKTLYFEMTPSVHPDAWQAWRDRTREMGRRLKSPYELTPSVVR